MPDLTPGVAAIVVLVTYGVGVLLVQFLTTDWSERQ